MTESDLSYKHGSFVEDLLINSSSVESTIVLDKVLIVTQVKIMIQTHIELPGRKCVILDDVLEILVF